MNYKNENKLTIKRLNIMIPRNLKQAFEQDYICTKIYAKGSKRIRVTVRPRFFNQGSKILEFWIDRDYFRRNYPNIYENN